MPNNISRMVGLSHAKPASRRTYHHGSHQQKNSSESESLDEQPVLSADAPAKDHLVAQLKSKLVNYMFFVDGSDKHLEQFCKSFADSPVELAVKIEMLKEIIELGKFKPVNLGVLVSKLPAACNSLDEFNEFILPFYNQAKTKLNEATDIDGNPNFIKNIRFHFLKTITHSLINRLSLNDLYKILKVKINGNSIVSLIYQTPVYDDDKLQLVKSIHKTLANCDQEQLNDATMIISNLIEYYKKNDDYHDERNWIIPSLTWILSKTETPKVAFNLVKECPIARSSDFIMKYITACRLALDVGIKRKEVRDAIPILFTIDPKRRKSPFDYVKPGSKGQALFELIESNLLPRDYVISNDDKELVFSYITSKLPAEKRNSVLLDLYNHAETKLNKHLWPQPHTFSIFHSKPHLSENWITEIKKHIDVNKKEDVKQEVRPS